jgi:hypothetical protein
MKAGVCSSPSFRASRCFAGLTRQWKNQPLRVVRFLRLLLLFWVTAVAMGRGSFLDSFADFLAPLPTPSPKSLPAAMGSPCFISWPIPSPPLPTSLPAALKSPRADSGPAPSLPAVWASTCPVAGRFSDF